MGERRCVGWRRSYHHLRRRLDLVFLWCLDYESERDRFGWFQVMTTFYFPGHWRCDCGTLVWLREHHARLADKTRERLMRECR
jgi:hypothetical protein